MWMYSRRSRPTNCSRLPPNRRRGSITVHRRDWQDADFENAAIAVGECEDDEQARRFRDAARAAGVPVNVIDKPDFCDFAFGSIVNRSPLVVGISTDGAAPVFGQAIRSRIEALLPAGFRTLGGGRTQLAT